ncbi:Hypothetical predicted protein [Paramuricea clavata]|uniref:Uncharacterized protein n=1 Tax=Paramuricea clavata TaxID=317549 RepID=A0A7D9M4N3_PARCT|nr:Hypothetical predicted protein [Paramuricea clavata]
MSQFLRDKCKSILTHLSKELEMRKGLKWFVSVKARFIKSKVDGEDLFSEPHFRNLCTTTVNVHDMKKQLQEASSKILDSLAIYQKEGSKWWILDEILHLYLNMAKYTPLNGSSYIPYHYYKQLKVPFVIYADFESVTAKIDSVSPNPTKSSTEKYQHHQPCGFSSIIVSEAEKYNKPPVVYRGEDAVDKFLECLETE